jgi:hypothetical protein
MGKSIFAVFIGYVIPLAGFVAAYVVLLNWFPDAVPAVGSAPAARLLIFLALFLFCLGTLGGWVAGRMVGHRQLQHGIALAILTILLGSLKPLLHPGAEPLWSHFTLVFAGAIGAVLGGGIASRSGDAVPKAN